jgi:glucose-1-phosphate cytidylyltransferase
MVEIGGRPILWHVMSIYARHGYRDFLVACGYRGECIKEYFQNFALRSSDCFVDLRTGACEVVNNHSADWRVGMVDTGLETMTGGRLLRLRGWLDGSTFMVTYGDGVGNVDIRALVEFHRSHGKVATITAVRPPARFGSLVLDGDAVCQFSEKSQVNEGWINGGFFVFEPAVFDYLVDDRSILERDTLERLASAAELCAFRHHGFWQPMDTLREKHLLETLWQSGKAPWAH